jgi:bacterioferritin
MAKKRAKVKRPGKSKQAAPVTRGQIQRVKAAASAVLAKLAGPPAEPSRVAKSPAASSKGGAEKARRKPFLTDVMRLRERARQHIEQGAVTVGYRADRTVVTRLLNEALATEIVCVLRYKRHYFMASGINAQSVAQEFLTHANEEQGHADEIARRIVQLGGEPNLSPDGLLTRSHAEYVEGTDLIDMIKEDLVAERVAIDSYREMITYLGSNDPTTRRMLEGILAMEEEHADDLVSLLAELGQ